MFRVCRTHGAWTLIVVSDFACAEMFEARRASKRNLRRAPLLTVMNVITQLWMPCLLGQGRVSFQFATPA